MLLVQLLLQITFVFALPLKQNVYSCYNSFCFCSETKCCLVQLLLAVRIAFVFALPLKQIVTIAFVNTICMKPKFLNGIFDCCVFTF
jgi:hypothetical protein